MAGAETRQSACGIQIPKILCEETGLQGQTQDCSLAFYRTRWPGLSTPVWLDPELQPPSDFPSLSDPPSCIGVGLWDFLAASVGRPAWAGRQETCALA